jgi:hypothetical protein
MRKVTTAPSANGIARTVQVLDGKSADQERAGKRAEDGAEPA